MIDGQRTAPRERTVVRRYDDYARPRVFAVLEGEERPAALRACLVDGDGDWWANVQWVDTPGRTRFSLVEAGQVSPCGELGTAALACGCV